MLKVNTIKLNFELLLKILKYRFLIKNINDEKMNGKNLDGMPFNFTF